MLKTESSNRHIIVDDYLLGELRYWKNQQVVNEKQFGDSYVYVYREDGVLSIGSRKFPCNTV